MREIGEVFKYGNIDLVVCRIEDNWCKCTGCYFYNDFRNKCIRLVNRSLTGECNSIAGDIIFKPYKKEEMKLNLEINLVEKLKDVPKGTEFFTTVWGKVMFLGFISLETKTVKIQIGLKTQENKYVYIYSNGCLKNLPGAECIIFPSEDNRDWDTYIYDPIHIGTPVMVRNEDGEDWWLRYYAGNGKCFSYQWLCDKSATKNWSQIIPVSEFDFINRCKKEKLE